MMIDEEGRWGGVVREKEREGDERLYSLRGGLWVNYDDSCMSSCTMPSENGSLKHINILAKGHIYKHQGQSDPPSQPTYLTTNAYATATTAATAMISPGLIAPIANAVESGVLLE